MADFDLCRRLPGFVGKIANMREFTGNDLGQHGAGKNSASHTPPFYPPHINPPDKLPTFPFSLISLLRNDLAVIPARAYREPIVVVRGPPRTAFITGTELVKKLLCEHPLARRGRLQVALLRPISGNAMSQADGAEWWWQRNAATPLFRHGELLSHVPIMHAAAEATIAKWRAAAPGTVHAIHDDMVGAVFHVIAHAILGRGSEDTLADTLAALRHAHADYYSHANWWMLYNVLGLPHWLPRPGGRSMRAYATRLRAAVAELVRVRRVDAASAEDLATQLLNAGDAKANRSMLDGCVLDNIVTFFLAGTEVVATALVWALYLISQSPEWESRMLEEIEEVAGCGPFTPAHFESLTIVQQVINESLRLFPPNPMMARDIVEDMVFAGVSIPAGTIGVIPIYAIHRHHTYWEDPDRFDPGRFSPANPRKPNRFQFMPFGAGPRLCIGAAFTMIKATIMLATFVRAARFAVDPGFEPQPAGRMIFLSKNGMPIRVTLRRSP